MTSLPSHEPAAGPPRSATRGWIVAVAFMAWFGALWFVRILHISDMVLGTMLCLAAPAVANYLLDIFVLKIHRSASSGLNWQNPHPSWRRTTVKFVGLLASLGFVAALYALFPEYSRDLFGANREHPVFYGDFRQMVVRFLPWLPAISIPYIYIIDSRQKDPKDGYYTAGMAALLQFGKVDWALLWQHCLGWLVKGFFLPLMFTYCIRDVRIFASYDFSIIQNFRTVYEFVYYFIFLTDVALSCVGYGLALRLCDTHVRRTEPTFKGWVVALVCYQPFWSWISASYLDYSNDYPWGEWLKNNPVIYTIWGSVILALYGVYVWCTIMFGARFSNLTNRGILTNGPYRWTKHPAYIAKTTAYWMTFVPFIISSTLWDSLRRCVLLGLTCYIYYLRAKTEEANLGADAAYVQYSEWINRHGVFRWLGRRAHSDSYKPISPE
jgi:protein-S-isoprenylcysteine O-methyltransferase Ste14